MPDTLKYNTRLCPLLVSKNKAYTKNIQPGVIVLQVYNIYNSWTYSFVLNPQTRPYDDN